MQVSKRDVYVEHQTYFSKFYGTHRFSIITMNNIRWTDIDSMVKVFEHSQNEPAKSKNTGPP